MAGVLRVRKRWSGTETGGVVARHSKEASSLIADADPASDRAASTRPGAGLGEFVDQLSANSSFTVDAMDKPEHLTGADL
jgi:hypothetical protein